MSKPSKEALFKWPFDGVTDTIEETLAVADADRVLVSWIKPWAVLDDAVDSTAGVKVDEIAGVDEEVDSTEELEDEDSITDVSDDEEEDSDALDDDFEDSDALDDEEEDGDALDDDFEDFEELDDSVEEAELEDFEAELDELGELEELEADLEVEEDLILDFEELLSFWSSPVLKPVRPKSLMTVPLSLIITFSSSYPLPSYL